jgi:hypothetical protein
MVFVKSFCIWAQLVVRKAHRALPARVSTFSITILLKIKFTGVANPYLSRRPILAVITVVESAENGFRRTALQYHCRIGAVTNINCSSTPLYGRSRVVEDGDEIANGDGGGSNGEEYGCS